MANQEKITAAAEERDASNLHFYQNEACENHVEFHAFFPTKFHAESFYNSLDDIKGMLYFEWDGQIHVHGLFEKEVNDD